MSRMADGITGAQAALESLIETLTESATELGIDPDDKWVSFNDVTRLLNAAHESVDDLAGKTA